MLRTSHSFPASKTSFLAARINLRKVDQLLIIQATQNQGLRTFIAVLSVIEILVNNYCPYPELKCKAQLMQLPRMYLWHTVRTV